MDSLGAVSSARHRNVMPEGVEDIINNQNCSPAGARRPVGVIPAPENLDNTSSKENSSMRTPVNAATKDTSPAKYSPPFANSSSSTTAPSPTTYSAAGNVPGSNWCGSAGNTRAGSSPDGGGELPKGTTSSSYSKCSLRRLMHRHELPKHLQFNPYIDTGYRPLLSAWECILSLFYLHNETVNIITHGVPMLYIFFMWRSMVPWDEIKIPVLPWTHLISCVSPWVGSTIYHMFMNHRAGESCYRSLLHLDMFGIWITQSFGALTTVYASVSCLSSAWVWRVLIGYSFVSFWCLYKASHARNPWERRFCFTLPFLMRAAAIVVRVSESGGGNPDAFRHILLQDFLAVLGGFVGALRIPEKWIPGRLDMLANSHHIMHVVVVWAVYHLHKGAILDLLWLSKNPQCHGVMDPESLL